MNVQSTRIAKTSKPVPPKKPEANQELASRVANEGKDTYRAEVNGVERAVGGAVTYSLGAVAGAAAGAGVVAGIAQLADAVLPGNVFPAVALWGPVSGAAVATLAGAAAFAGAVEGYKGQAGAHTNAMGVRSSFRYSAGLAATAAGAFLGGAAGIKAADFLAPQYALAGGLIGAAAGALGGAKVSKTVKLFGGNLATIPMMRHAGTTGSPYSGNLHTPDPPKAQQTHSKFTPLFNDKPATADILKSVAAAKKSIRFETYLLNGEDGKAMADLLIKKAKEGLDVKVILDPFFQGYEAKKFPGDPQYALGQYLKDNGVDYLPYPTGKLTGSMTPSEHAKILVLDDQIAYLGGTNIDDTNNKDTNVKIEGSAAADIAKLFDESWAVSENTDPNALGLSGDPVISDPNIKVFSTSPSRSTIKQAVINNIREAQKSIKIQMFTLTDDDLVKELKAASDRGVKVQLQLCDNKEIFHLPTYHVPNLPTALQAKKSGIDVKWYVNPEFTQMHSKLMIFDDEKIMLGSMNGIHNAFRGIHEYYSEIKDKDLAHKMADQFQDDWEHRSDVVTSTLGYRALGAVVEAVDGTIF